MRENSWWTQHERGDYGDGCACEVEVPIKLEMMLETWDSLVNLITSKMPGLPSTKTDEVLISCLFSISNLQVPLFASAFLSRAKKPPFKMVAPELLVPDDEFIHRFDSQLAERYGPVTESL